MEIIVGKLSGFCAGVKNAVEKAEEQLDKDKQKIFCLGEIVHNRQVVERLESKGLETVDNINKVNGKTIIRAHGVDKEVYEKAKKKEIELIDLTCPKVLAIHKIAEEYQKKGYFIILIGVENHPEVIGTISFCGEDKYLLTNEENIQEAIEKVKESHANKVLIMAQTTFSLKRFEKISEEIKKSLENKYKVEIKNTICSATRLRQEETEKISEKVDYMIIIGGKNSSNTKKLYDIAKSNCEKTILVETLKDLRLKEIKRFNKIGIMAGASTPQESINEIKEAISK